MKRVYKRKGAAALTAKITIPITAATDERLRSVAAQRQTQPTELARTLLLTGLLECEGS